MNRLRTTLLASPAFFMAAGAFAAEENAVPQMDQTWYPNQLFWLAISFVLLYVMVAKLIVPSVSRVLDDRQNALQDAIREAETAKRTATAARSHGESEGQSARTKAAHLIAEVQAETARDTTLALAKVEHEVERKLEQAQVRIGNATDEALKTVREATVSLTATMVSQLLGSKISEKEVDFAVSSKIASKKSAA
jgi:F-type H+-transporting ATPase subunit b